MGTGGVAVGLQWGGVWGQEDVREGSSGSLDDLVRLDKTSWCRGRAGGRRRPCGGWDLVDGNDWQSRSLVSHADGGNSDDLHHHFQPGLQSS